MEETADACQRFDINLSVAAEIQQRAEHVVGLSVEPQPGSRPAPCGLTPDQQFQFDVRGFVVLPGALSAAAIAAINPRLDTFEQLAQRHQAAHPELEDGRVEVVEGKQVSTHQTAAFPPEHAQVPAACRIH